MVLFPPGLNAALSAEYRGADDVFANRSPVRAAARLLAVKHGQVDLVRPAAAAGDAVATVALVRRQSLNL